jgi:hypothetical protein
MKIETCGFSTSRRIVSDDGSVVAMCERYMSGMWAIHGINGRPMTPASFTSPTKALRDYEKYAPSKDPT